MKLEVAVTSPHDNIPNAVYVEYPGRYGKSFYNLGDTNHADRTHLETRGAQFHTVDIPEWKDPIPLAVGKLNQLVGDLEWDLLGTHANNAKEVVKLLKGVK